LSILTGPIDRQRDRSLKSSYWPSRSADISLSSPVAVSDSVMAIGWQHT